MAKFAEGDFVVHAFAHKGYGFIIRPVMHRSDEWHVFHLGSMMNPSNDVEVYLKHADRAPTDDELAAYTKFRLLSEG